jgi:hypothetical protein
VAGTGELYFGSSPLTAANQLLAGTGGSEGGIATLNTALGSLAANITVGARFDSGNAGATTGEFPLDGQIDDLRLFTLTTAGQFNIADTNPAVSSHRPGDANGDGKVDINDLTIVLSSFGQTGCAWSQGCMDGDPTGKVDINDLTIVLSSFGTTYTAAGIKAVPEPSCLALIGIGAVALLAFARRRRR